MPHPCALNSELEGCAELAEKYVAEVVEAPATAIVSLKEALVTHAPAITGHINAAMAKVGQWVEATENLAAEQMPLLVNEIVYWGIAEAGFGVALGLFFMVSLPISVAHLHHSSRAEGRKGFAAACSASASDSDTAVAVIGMVILPIIGSIVFCCHIMAFLKPIVAPRLYLIEYVRQLAG